MSRGTRTPTSVTRPLTVWLLISAGVVSSWVGVGASVTSLASGAVWHGTFEDLLVAVASVALVAGAGWLWLVTSLTVAGLLRGRESTGRGLTRRLVLTACGVAVVAGVASPALAGGGSGEQVLAGLPLPDRAVAGAEAHHAQEPVRAARPPVSTAASGAGRHEPVTVRRGDSLWSIAAADLGPDAGPRDIDERWRALYAANRDAIGTDPDLITPGQHLLSPTDPDRDRDR